MITLHDETSVTVSLRLQSSSAVKLCEMETWHAKGTSRLQTQTLDQVMLRLKILSNSLDEAPAKPALESTLKSCLSG